jgi:diguanylate cyclase (GGDEF)-like protein
LLNKIAFLEEELHRTQKVVEELKICVAQQYYDELTGLYNRKAYNEKIQEVIEQYDLYAVAICDVDNFKQINDIYGHLTGDTMLIYLADILCRLDFVCRYGGDEFIIILNASGAEEKINYWHEQIKKYVYSKLQIPITLSIGLTFVQNFDTPETLFERADMTLYRAKNLGKDRVEICE